MRALLIDVLRGYGILLVVLGHLIAEIIPDYSANLLFMFIYSFHMPLFFIIAGYLCCGKIRSLPVFVYSKFRRLIIPYQFFTLIILCLGFKDALHVFWFTPTLFICLLLLAFIVLKDVKMMLFSLLCLLLLSQYNYSYLLQIFWYTCFVFAGYLYSYNTYDMRMTKTLGLMPLPAFIQRGTIIFFWIKFCIALFIVGTSAYVLNKLPQTIKNTLALLGRYSLEIYFIHIIILEIIF